MEAVTFHGGKRYLHSEYTTAAKRKNLPENVKKAIMGKDYVEPIEDGIVEEPIPTTTEEPIV